VSDVQGAAFLPPQWGCAQLASSSKEISGDLLYVNGLRVRLMFQLEERPPHAQRNEKLVEIIASTDPSRATLAAPPSPTEPCAGVAGLEIAVRRLSPMIVLIETTLVAAQTKRTCWSIVATMNPDLVAERFLASLPSSAQAAIVAHNLTDAAQQTWGANTQSPPGTYMSPTRTPDLALQIPLFRYNTGSTHSFGDQLVSSSVLVVIAAHAPGDTVASLIEQELFTVPSRSDAKTAAGDATYSTASEWWERFETILNGGKRHMQLCQLLHAPRS